MYRLLMATAALLASGAALEAAGDGEASQPYEYRVIVRVAPHGLLRPAFRRQLCAELQDSLQAALGALARVEVQDADILPKDAWIDPAALDSRTDAGTAKRHFVDVSVADGRYVIRARQHDGSTGLAGPVVREARTADRAFIGRLISRFIDQDFAPTGAIVGYDKATDKVTLALRGGELAPAELARLVPTGSVFALARLEGSPPQGRPIESAYLVTLAESKDGRCDCRFVYRFQNQLIDHAAVRAVKLGTSQGPVRLRLVDRNGLPLTGLQVRLSQDGFRPTDPVRDQGTIRDGTYESTNSYDRIAYALILSGATQVAQVPVPVIDDRVTVARLNPVKDGERRQRLELDAHNTRQRLHDIHQRLRGLNAHLAILTTEKKHREAAESVKQNLSTLDGELGPLTSEADRLRREVASLADSAAKAEIDQFSVYFREIRGRREILARQAEDLKNVIQVEDKQLPERESYLVMNNLADHQREEAEFDEALKTYDEILKRFGDREEIRKRRDELAEGWKIKSETHRLAREFAYGPWAKSTTVDAIRANLPKAREALETCKKVDDRLTPRKFMLGGITATEILTKAADELKKSESDADRLTLRGLLELISQLQTFIREANAMVHPADQQP
jgi:hypothetical protein